MSKEPVVDRSPPDTPGEPVAEARHGDRYEEPYRWLEWSDDAAGELE